MYDVILFGGTTEGRLLCEFLSENKIKTLVCTATEYGEDLVNITSENLSFSHGKKSECEINALISSESPRLLIDATHPYAENITKFLRSACERGNIRYLRVLRESRPMDGCTGVSSLDEMISLLNSRSGVIFSALGGKEAQPLTAVSGYKSRLFLRLLPRPEVLSSCLSLGYPASSLICMQGPFSYELNRAMFSAVGANILITKESGAVGGFDEKLRAALSLGMEVIVLRRPAEKDGLSLSEACLKAGDLIK